MSSDKAHVSQVPGSKPQQSARWRRVVAKLILLLALSPCFAWGMLAFLFGSWPRFISLPLAALYAIGSAAVLILMPLRRAGFALAGLFVLPLACHCFMRPALDRTWQPDVAAMPYAEINGDHITLHNVRNCSYLSATNYTVRYETRTYDLARLSSADILFSDWGLKDVAHTMVSFGFEGGDYLCVSIETRKEVGESYSALKGFFRQYELIYIAADERDVIRLRTDYRQGEDVYLYRLRVVARAQLRRAFLDYLGRMNQLRVRAEWYNALVDNCMTSGYRIMRRHAAPGRADLHWSVILNGRAPDHAYSTGVLDRSLPFDELKRRSRINDRARAAGDAPDFSARIREGMPGMDWLPAEGD
jgi:hypothetical protein